MELQYRREKEEADLLLEQQRLVGSTARRRSPGDRAPPLTHHCVFAVRRQ